VKRIMAILSSRRVWLTHAALVFLVSGATAQDKFPSRPIKIIVGSEAGSAPDALARLLATELGPLLKQSVLVENKPGAAGTVGAGAVVAAPADGYTLLMGTISNVALAPSFYALKYDPVKSFTPIGMVASVPLVLVTAPSFQVNDIKQFTEKVKKSNQLNYASPGIGGPQHLAGVMLQRQLGTQLLHVPYKSGGAVTTAVLSGDVQFAFVGIPAAASLVSAKKLVALMVTSAKRSVALPEIPSATEAGLRGFEIDNWHALLAPAGLPAHVREAIESVLQSALKSTIIKEQFQKLGAEPALVNGQQLEGYIAAETERWAKLVTESKLKVEE
jgi:tripartite-type tricarboxylate transporter receptor subunit TctC